VLGEIRSFLAEVKRIKLEVEDESVINFDY
jgi:hypothetical protein